MLAAVVSRSSSSPVKRRGSRFVWRSLRCIARLVSWAYCLELITTEPLVTRWRHSQCVGWRCLISPGAVWESSLPSIRSWGAPRPRRGWSTPRWWRTVAMWPGRTASQSGAAIKTGPWSGLGTRSANQSPGESAASSLRPRASQCRRSGLTQSLVLTSPQPLQG